MESLPEFGFAEPLALAQVIKRKVLRRWRKLSGTAHGLPGGPKEVSAERTPNGQGSQAIGRELKRIDR